MIGVMNNHTILFNIASRNILKLTPEVEIKVKNHIMDIMNGDGLYDGSSEEAILEAYFSQENCDPHYDLNWADLIRDILHDIM